MKVKIIEAGSTSKLEEEINKFLETIEPVREGAQSVVVDIKYTTSVYTEYWAEGERTANESNYSAMIIYK